MTDYEDRTRNEEKQSQLSGGIIVTHQRRQSMGTARQELGSINSSNYFKQRHNSQVADQFDKVNNFAEYQPKISWHARTSSAAELPSDAYSSTIKKESATESSPVKSQEETALNRKLFNLTNTYPSQRGKLVKEASKSTRQMSELELQNISGAISKDEGEASPMVGTHRMNLVEAESAKSCQALNLDDQEP